MASTTPLAFRPSFMQRTTAVLLFVGSWMVGLRVGSELLRHLPRMWMTIHQAKALGEPTTVLWLLFSASILAGLVGTVGLLLSLGMVVLLEGTHVMVDELGIAVQIHLLPPRLAAWAGAGRLAWKHVGRFHRWGPFFVLHSAEEGKPQPGRVIDPTLRFLMVDELEILVTTIMDRSPHVKVD